jgi:hypothetical protein
VRRVRGLLRVIAVVGLGSLAASPFVACGSDAPAGGSAGIGNSDAGAGTQAGAAGAAASGGAHSAVWAAQTAGTAEGVQEALAAVRPVRVQPWPGFRPSSISAASPVTTRARWGYPPIRRCRSRRVPRTPRSCHTQQTKRAAAHELSRSIQPRVTFITRSTTPRPARELACRTSRRWALQSCSPRQNSKPSALGLMAARANRAQVIE